MATPVQKEVSVVVLEDSKSTFESYSDIKREVNEIASGYQNPGVPPPRDSRDRSIACLDAIDRISEQEPKDLQSLRIAAGFFILIPDEDVVLKAVHVLKKSFSLMNLRYDLHFGFASALCVQESELRKEIERRIDSIENPNETLIEMLSTYEKLLELIWLAALMCPHRDVAMEVIGITMPKIVQEGNWEERLARVKDEHKELKESLQMVLKRVHILKTPLTQSLQRVFFEIKALSGSHLFFGGLAEAYQDLSEYELAIDCIERGLEIINERLDVKRGDADLEQQKVQFQVVLGNTYTYMGRYDEAVRCHQWSLEMARESGDKVVEARALVNLGNAYKCLNQHEKALEYQLLAITIGESEGIDSVVANGNRNVGNIYREMGNATKALEYHEKQFEFAMTKNFVREQLTATMEKSEDLMALGRTAEAINLLYQLIPNAKAVGDMSTLKEAYMSMGIAFKNLSRYQEAEACISSVLHVAKLEGDQKTIANCLGNLGNLKYDLGNTEEGIELHMKQLEISKKLSDQKKIASAYGHIGNGKCLLHDIKGGIEYYLKQYAILENASDKVGLASTLGRLGSAFQDIGLYEKAVEFQQYHLASAIESKDDRNLGIAHSNLARALSSLKRYEEAEEHFRLAVESFSRTGDREGLGTVYTNYGGLEHKRGKTDEAISTFKKSIDLYAENRKDLSADQSKIAIFEQHSKPYHGLENTLSLGGRTTEALEASEQRRSLSLNGLLLGDKVSAAGIEDIKEYAATANCSVIYFSLVPFYDGRPQITLWLVNPSRDVFSKTVEDPALFELGGALKGPEGGETTKRSVERDQTTEIHEIEEAMRGRRNPAAAKARAFRKKLQMWYRAFISPIKEHLPPEAKLVIIPEGFISQLPFAIFLDEEGKYLVENHPLSVAPSVQTLKLLQERRGSREPAKGSLIVGNPEAGVEAAELPMAEQEALRLRELLGTPDEKLLVRGQAKVGAVTEAMRSTQYIHLACHGELNQKTNIHSVFEGAFLMSPDEDHKKGLLYAEEIGKLDLKADLVFLSACHSGKGAIKREGVIGHMRSFLAAGASSVVGTLWSLPDSELTVDMVTKFYERVTGGMPKDEALREVMLMAIEQKRNFPHAWGAFVLTGLPD